MKTNISSWLLCSLLLQAGALPGSPGVPPSMPMPIVEAETANDRWLHKPVLATKLLDDMEQTNGWSHFGQGRMLLTTDRFKDGQHSLRLVSPTITERPNTSSGRPFGECRARRNFAGEDWTAYNRISFQVYPHLPGFRVISMLVRLQNAGNTKVPDSYGREGLNYVLLKPDQWNHVVWEIPHLARDKVTGVELIYRLQGHEPGATNTVCFDFDTLELQRVDADTFEGWTVAPGKIAFSHSGYQLGASKAAIASGLQAHDFTLVEQGSGQPVLTRPIRSEQTPLGAFQVLTFSEIDRPGIYRLEAGEARTPWFPIAGNIWGPSVWKTINFFFCERCGAAIPGIHDVCHGDWQAEHAGRKIIINGGWHDAGDLSQGAVNTAEATSAMFALAEALEEGDPVLARRLVEEGRWGLEWLEKTRFGDGFRVNWATMDYWTDGQIGTADDTRGGARNSPFENSLAAAAEAAAARVLKKSDPALAARSLKIAQEDWQFAIEKLTSPNVELASAAAQASLALFKAAREQKYADKAVEQARIILQSQEREYTSWRVPLTGFFYSNPKRERLLHYFHRSHEQAPVVALAELCEALPAHADWMQWYSAVALYSEYLKRVAQFTEPYGMLPASVYSLDESNEPRFKAQVLNGVQLSDKHYLRRFPVWYDFRGNFGTGLSQTKALSAAARLRGDAASADLVQRQLQWVVGRNPFCQSAMYGEGHDYAPQYTAMSGDMVGSLPVGIQTRENGDLPYWPAANCYNYKEVWVHPSARWLDIMVDVMAPKPIILKEPVFTFQLAQAPAANDKIEIRLSAKGQGRHSFSMRVYNLKVPVAEQTTDLGTGQSRELKWLGQVASSNAPWVAVIFTDGSLASRKEISGIKLK